MNIVFCLSRFLDGGLDTVCVEYLRGLTKLYPDVKLTLAIMLRHEGKEVFLDRLPQSVKVVHLINEKALLKYVAARHNGLASKPQKICDELIFNPLRRLLIRSRLRHLQNTADCIIDFDAQARSFIKFNSKCKTIVYFH